MITELPRLLILTDAERCPRRLETQVELAVEAGARAFVLREKVLPPPRRRGLARRLASILSQVDGLLIVADPTWTVDACHLSAAAEPPLPRPGLVGRSAHHGRPRDPAAEYVTYSPIYPTSSKPGYGPALGCAELARYCAASPIPVYALGGVDSARRVAECRDAGAHGVAVMGAVMHVPDPARAVRELLTGLD
ncbi:MAG: thiamine phosphate synthase [Stackebrandtia sp.]